MPLGPRPLLRFPRRKAQSQQQEPRLARRQLNEFLGKEAAAQQVSTHQHREQNEERTRPLKPPFQRDIRIDGCHGGSRQIIIKTGSDFLIGPVVEINGLVDALGTRHTLKRCPSKDRLIGNKTEKKTVSSTRWEQQPGTAPQTIESAAESENGPTFPASRRRRVGHRQAVVEVARSGLLPENWSSRNGSLWVK